MSAIVVITDAEPEKIAEFLAELSAIYSDLSDGDELIITEATCAGTN